MFFCFFVRLEESRGLIQSHFVKLDFAGWRVIELDGYETTGLFETLFPRTVFPDDLRGFNLDAVVALSVYLTNATQAQIDIGSVESLQEDDRAAPTRGATITVSGASIRIPDGLNAAVIDLIRASCCDVLLLCPAVMLCCYALLLCPAVSLFFCFYFWDRFTSW